ncbi:hypothetical protein ACFOEW_09380 [Alteromonas oceani]|uniref:Uncharacterized protein n=1 Tax=Alteromonas oceani TaxID=2071609 RepID=A0ABV7JVN7_9ALTE|nr:hypothetical protein [Alteromonas oceani]
MNIKTNRHFPAVALSQFSSPLAGYTMQCLWRRWSSSTPKK